MNSDAFARIAANLPPQQWSVLRIRLELLGDYRKLTRPTRSDAQKAAAKLGMNYRSFYRLIRALEVNKIEGSRSERRGSNLELSPEIEQIISAAIETLGPEATATSIHDEVVLRCSLEGYDAPSPVAISTRLDDEPWLPDMQARLRRPAALVLDAAVLGLASHCGASVILSTLIEVPTGLVLRHEVDTSLPSATVFASMLANVEVVGLSHGARVVRTTSVPDLTEIQIKDVHRQGLVIDPSTRGLPAGAALRAVFGRRIGRTKIYALDLHQKPLKQPVVSISDARAIIEVLVDRRNSATKERRGGTSS